MINDVKFEFLIDELTEEMVQVCQNTLNAAGQFAVDAARSTTLFNHSKAFDDGIIATQIADNIMEVVSNKDIYLEEGNNQNGDYIYPVNAKALRFEIDGEVIFAAKIKAHGPYPYMAQAAEQTQDNIERIFLEESNKIIKD